MTSKKDTTFSNWELPRRDTPQLLVSRYRIYTDAENYVIVEAENAMDALKISGQKNAKRIERDILFFNNVLNPGTFEDAVMVPEAQAPVVIQPEMMQEEVVAGATVISEPVAPVVSQPVAAAAPEVVAAPPAMSDAPLSDEEVNKLLQG